MRERFVAGQQYVSSYTDTQLIYLVANQYYTVTSIQCSSSNDATIKISVNHVPMMTYRIQKHSNLFIPMKLHLDVNDVVQVHGQSNEGSSLNVSMIYYDNQEAWDKSFIQELETTLKT